VLLYKVQNSVFQFTQAYLGLVAGVIHAAYFRFSDEKKQSIKNGETT